MMQIRLKQPSSLHRPLVQLRIFSPPFGLGLVVLLVVLVGLVVLVVLVRVLVLVVGRVFVLAYKCRLRAYIYKLGLKFELGGGLGLKFEPGLKFERGLGILSPAQILSWAYFLSWKF